MRNIEQNKEKNFPATSVQVSNADDSTIIAPVWKEVNYSDQLVSQFLDWTMMKCLATQANVKS